MRLTSLTLALFAVGALCAARSAPAQSTGGPATPGTGAYTAEQAERGSKAFGVNCLECHPRVDMASPDFKFKWNGMTAFDLFDRITTSMPEKAPGTLALDDYVDVLAYLLKINGLPAGPAPLTGDGAALRRVKLVMSAPPPLTASSAHHFSHRGR